MVDKPKNIAKKNERYLYISLLYSLSAIAVIMLHANGAFWFYRNDRSWAINNIIESLFYFAVPIFFMLTGATLMNYNERYSTKIFLKRRLIKTFIPFIFWSLFSFFFYALFRGKQYDISAEGIFNGIFNYEFLDIYWFFGPLFGVYLSMPLFALINKGKKEKLLKYFLLIGFLLNILIPFTIGIINYFCKINLRWSITVPVMGNYLLYAVAGYLLSTLKITKKQRVILYILGFIGLAVMLVGTHILSRDNGAVSSLFKGYQNLPVFLYSIAIFLFVKELSRHKFLAKLQRVIGIIAKYSFSLYLTHRFVLIYASSIAINNIGLANGSLAYVLVSTTITIVCCIAIASLLRKLPFGKLILP